MTIDENKEEQPEGEQNLKGVVIPEEFQSQVHQVLQKATTKHHLSHMADRVHAKQDEMRKKEMEAERSKQKKGKVDEYTDVAMPSSY
jgi:hypothetical protein